MPQPFESVQVLACKEFEQSPQPLHFQLGLQVSVQGCAIGGLFVKTPQLFASMQSLFCRDLAQALHVSHCQLGLQIGVEDEGDSICTVCDLLGACHIFQLKGFHQEAIAICGTAKEMTNKTVKIIIIFFIDLFFIYLSIFGK